tara:strand:- start:65 stop:202 length:138 start_codon:yes stop_codon:yes gene_type:complete
MTNIKVGISISKARRVYGTQVGDVKKVDGTFLKLVGGGFIKLVNQ